MLEEVRKFEGLEEILTPSKEEQEVLDQLKSFLEELKGTGVTDSNTSTFESARLTPKPAMTDGTPGSTIEAVINETVITCPIDDPNPPEYCNPIDIDWDLA